VGASVAWLTELRRVMLKIDLGLTRGGWSVAPAWPGGNALDRAGRVCLRPARHALRVRDLQPGMEDRHCCAEQACWGGWQVQQEQEADAGVVATPLRCVARPLRLEHLALDVLADALGLIHGSPPRYYSSAQQEGHVTAVGSQFVSDSPGIGISNLRAGSSHMILTRSHHDGAVPPASVLIPVHPLKTTGPDLVNPFSVGHTRT
jgi:hypothetical protein